MEGSVISKRKASGVQPKTRAPRKKQAVKKTNSAAVIALIRRNSETSPLLKLAPEVREKILLYIVGGHFVHVQHSSDAEFGFRNIDSRISDCDAEGWPTTPKGFRHVICQAEISETAAHRESRDGYAEVPKEDSPEYYVQGCSKRHADCLDLLEDRVEQCRRIDLNVLGTSRQLYEEANYLLWTTSTFSFRDPTTFANFIASLNLAQKRILTTLHFSAIMKHKEHINWVNWQKAIKPSFVCILRGLKTLHLCFEQRINDSIPSPWTDAPHVSRSEHQQMFHPEPFVQFRTLSLKKVTVMVTDDREWLAPRGFLGFRWTADQKNVAAEYLEHKLMDPNIAKTMETEQELRRIAVCLYRNGTYSAKILYQQSQVSHVQACAEKSRARLEQALANGRNSIAKRQKEIAEHFAARAEAEAGVLGQMEATAAEHQRETEMALASSDIDWYGKNVTKNTTDCVGICGLRGRSGWVDIGWAGAFCGVNPWDDVDEEALDEDVDGVSQ